MRTEKDDDELAHDVEISQINSKLYKCQDFLSHSSKRLMIVIAQQKKYETLYPTGLQLLARVQSNRDIFLSKCYSTFSAPDAVKSVSGEAMTFGESLRENAGKYKEV